MYIQSYRTLGIFYENAVNKILRDVVSACQPKYAKVTGEFTTRGGMRSVIEAEYRVDGDMGKCQLSHDPLGNNLLGSPNAGKF